MIEAGPGTRLHRIWKGMKARCQTATNSSYPNYGARGVRVCADWQTFVGFLDWALDAGYAAGLEIDRIDPRKGYNPDNCRWIDAHLNRSRPILGSDQAGGEGRLTDSLIEAAIPRSYAFRLADSERLHVLVLPTGTRSWRLRSRIGGVDRIVTIGRYPAMPIAVAREHAAVAQARLVRGADPIALVRRSKDGQKRGESGG